MSDPQQYTVGWICALVTEFVAAQAFFDEEHDELEIMADNDNNSYALGRIGKHNVVMAVLPKSEYGTTSAATVARDMLRTFPNVRIGLMVGIGGGAPAPHAQRDVRLGDIVVSSRDNGKGGVFQYDYGKAIQDWKFEHTGTLNQPPPLLLTAVGKLEAKYRRKGHQLSAEIDRALEQWPKLRKEYSRPPVDMDRLYRSDFVHQNSAIRCEELCGNDPTLLISRPERDEQDDNPAIHYGIIASANQLMKDAIARDELAASHGVLCFEMEAAGLMNHFPCLVIRGICDYSDSHKNKQWQGFAAMAAAAYAKDLLNQILPSRIEGEKPVIQVLNSIEQNLSTVQQAVVETNVMVATMNSDTRVTKIQQWLNPPDYSTNANHAKKRRHVGTGQWLINSSAFQEWKSGARRNLWLHGLAGCGKTVLSTVILDDLQQANPGTSLAHFFDFNDLQKQTFNGFLRSIAFQIYLLSGEGTEKLDKLYTSCDSGTRQPDELALVACLDSMMQAIGAVSIVIDALDECNTRDEILSWIGSQSLGAARFIITARPEADLRREIPRYFSEENCISLDKKSIDADIHSYVLWTIEHSPSFNEKGLSQDLVKEISEKVGDGADGMFQWAYCQLSSLAKCPSPNAIRKTLSSLPRDLNATYRGMLNSIPSDFKSDAIRLLQFLVHSETPLRISEAIEIIATKIDDDSQRFDVENRLFSEADVLRYCPSLVSIVSAKAYNGRNVKELHLIHFSVKEYLLTTEGFDLETSTITITRVCLTYLTDIEGELSTIANECPLAWYAACYWLSFAPLAEKSEMVVQLAARFLQTEVTFRRWCHLYNPDEDWIKFGVPNSTGTKIYYACGAGLEKVTRVLIDSGCNVNEQGGFYGNPLQVATHNSHLDLVRLLLDNGADPNAEGGHYGNALQAASYAPNLEMMRLLLDKGADVNVQGGKYGSALQAVCSRRSVEGVQLLLDKGADTNTQGGRYGNVLQAACSGGNFEITKILLEKGVEVNQQGGTFGTALQVASYRGHLDIVRLLLDKGADVNASGGRYDFALHGASHRGRLDIVQLLLDKGADISAVSDRGWTAVNEAAYNGHKEVVEYLIEKGADITVPDRHNRTPIFYAAQYGNLSLLKVLQAVSDAELYKTDDSGRSTLFMSSRYGRVRVVEYLLADARIDPMSRDWRGSTALFAAVANGHERTVELLLPRYSSLTNHGGFGKSLIWWARRASSPRIVELLLEHGEPSLSLANEEPFTEIVATVPFDIREAWCDACTCCVSETSRYSCKECKGITICGNCFDRGIKCRDPSHLELYKKPLTGRGRWERHDEPNEVT
ncbi:Ankyrin repeat and KH domain-containing protein [Paramyrothecium foliicola]|nr:Ankyrin repeat and KH domain-containing protein [Paramyrothecium foliicola]